MAHACTVRVVVSHGIKDRAALRKQRADVRQKDATGNQCQNGQAYDKSPALPKQDGALAELDVASAHLLIFVTRPAPTVRPPSRMANRWPSSSAIGWISSTLISVLSPGMTISVPSGSVTTPVTSVVRT